MNRPRTGRGRWGPQHERLRWAPRAFTLIESLLAAAVLLTAITAITLPFAVGARNEQVDARMTLAVNLAQEMMEEILSKPFDDPQGTGTLPGPEAGETKRAKYDNIDDYHGYNEAPGSIADASGTVISTPASDGLSRSVTAEYVYVSGQDMSQPATFIRVTVTVAHRGVSLVSLTRLVYDTP